MSKDFLQAKFVEAEQRTLALQVTVLNQSETIKKLETNPPASAASAPSAKNEPRIPDPPKFNGERRALLPFLAKCRLKFVGQPLSFPTEATKVIYAGSRLEGPPFSWFSPLNDRLQDPEEKDPEELLTFDTLAKHLTTLNIWRPQSRSHGRKENSCAQAGYVCGPLYRRLRRVPPIPH